MSCLRVTTGGEQKPVEAGTTHQLLFYLKSQPLFPPEQGKVPFNFPLSEINTSEEKSFFLVKAKTGGFRSQQRSSSNRMRLQERWRPSPASLAGPTRALARGWAGLPAASSSRAPRTPRWHSTTSASTALGAPVSPRSCSSSENCSAKDQRPKRLRRPMLTMMMRLL